MKEYFAFPKSPRLRHLAIRLFNVISKILVGGGLTPSAKMQLVYSTALVDWAFLTRVFSALNITCRTRGNQTERNKSVEIIQARKNDLQFYYI